MNRSIYLLSPRQLSPETIAVAFAKTSRSPESFREIAAELNDAESAKFHEKWVVGYGHASVAEHAVLHIAFENVSRLAIECIESNRLASYTEKSTRYQKWNPNSFYTPDCIAASEHNDLYQHACAKLFDTYQKSLAPLKAWVESRHPRHDGESEAKYDGRIRSKYVDNCRYLLPASSLANVGMTANARVIENAIRKMLSHPLQEVREIGEEVRKVALGETPTLVKYADRVPYLADVQNRKSEIPKSQNPLSQTFESWITLNDYDTEGENKFLAAFLYRFGGMSFEEALEGVTRMNDDQRTALAHDALGELDKYNAPIRELEHITYTFDVVMDQGAYFELKRHRMMTQTPQRLTADLGWATPSAFEFSNFRDDYESAMQIAAETYHTLAADFPEEASYVIPNGFNRRVLMTLNLRQAFALCELRTTPGAHFAVRRITAKMYEMIRDVHPLLSKFIRCGERPRSDEIEKEFFVRVK